MELRGKERTCNSMWVELNYVGVEIVGIEREETEE